MRALRARLTAALAVVASTAVLGTAPATADTTSTEPPLTVLSTNLMMLPPVAGDWGNSTRAAMVANAPYVQGFDAVVVQEIFDNGPSDTLRTGLSDEYPHQTPVLGRSTSGWDDTQGSYSHLTPEDGGVAVLSRWPIERQVQHVFSRGCGADWFSNKGFVYARLNVRGAPVHIIGTHLQAEDSLCSDAAGVRRSQLTELRTFVDRLAIPQSEQVVIAGDLNINRTSPEYDTMRTVLGVEAPSYAGHPYSWDPKRNGLNAARNGDTAQEHLDYVLPRAGHRGAKGWQNTVLTPTSPAWTVGGATYRDYSDHYPVAAAPTS
jgi:sphingomyelin phosphodiesterase